MLTLKLTGLLLPLLSTPVTLSCILELFAIFSLELQVFLGFWAGTLGQSWDPSLSIGYVLLQSEIYLGHGDRLLLKLCLSSAYGWINIDLVVEQGRLRDLEIIGWLTDMSRLSQEGRRIGPLHRDSLTLSLILAVISHAAIQCIMTLMDHDCGFIQCQPRLIDVRIPRIHLNKALIPVIR